MSFSQFISILRARKWIAIWVWLLTVTVTTVVSYLLPNAYQATTSLVFNSKGADPVTGFVMPTTLMPGYMATQVDIIKSRTVAMKVVKKLGVEKSKSAVDKFLEETDGAGDINSWYADRFLTGLDVEPSRQSNIIEIRYTWADPDFAANMANAFAKAYLDTNLELKIEPVKQAAKFFQNQLNGLREDVENAQAKLSGYQREHEITSEAGRLDVEMSRLAELSSHLVAAQAQTYAAASKHKQLRKSGAASSPEVLSNPLIQGLKSNLIQAEAKFSDMSQRLGKNHPLYIAAEEEVQSLKKSLNKEVSRASVGVGESAKVSELRESEIKAALAAQKERVLKLKSEQDEMAALVREAESAQRIYDNALLKFSQTNIESQSSQTDIVVLNPATPPVEHAKPRRKLNIVLSFILGTLLAAAFSLVFEFFDRKVRTADDIVRSLEISVLADLSKEKHTWVTKIRSFLQRNKKQGSSKKPNQYRFN